MVWEYEIGIPNPCLSTMDDVRYYVAGGTGMTPENQDIQCDVELIPVGGKYTMDCREAAKLVSRMKPKIAIPTHYGQSWVPMGMENGQQSL